MSGFDRSAIFPLAKAKVPDLSGAKGGGSLTQDKGKSAPGKPTVIDCSSLKQERMKYHYIINASGQEVYREKEHKAYSVVKSIDLSPFENGIYFLKVEMTSKIQVKKIVLFK